MAEPKPRPRRMNSVSEELRSNGILCDAILKVQDAEFQVHKVLLCNVTPYFRALFTRWSEPRQSVYVIPGLSPEMMHLILQFAYTGTVSVTERNVQELMLAADQLNITGVVGICSDFFRERLCPDNCVSLWQFTKIIMSPKLHAEAFRCIIECFEELVVCQDYLQLTVQELVDIISRDDLNVRLEVTVYEGVMRWIRHAPAERERHIVTLLSHVRMKLMSQEFLRYNALSCHLVNNNTECRNMVMSALTMIEHIQVQPSLYNYFVRPRLPNASLLATGGWSGGDPTNGIEVYDFRTDTWITVENTEPPRAYHGAAFLNGFVYYVGGFDRFEHFNTVRKFDPVRHTWHEAAPMHYRRCYVSVTVLNGCIYALGGYDGQNRLKTAEYYRPEINQWSLIPPMHERRSDASCSTLNNKVYICGGFTGHECLRTAESYDPETNQWTMIPPMSCCRSGVGVVAYADQIFSVGGFDGNNRLRSAEAYDPQTNTWHDVNSIITPRSNFGIEVLDERLFVVGGFNGVTTTNNVEFYDIILDEWIEICDMEIFRSALSCCVIFGLPNMADYAVPRDSMPLVQVEEESEEEEDSDSRARGQDQNPARA